MVRLRVTATVRLVMLVNCVNPQYSCGPARLLLSCHGLEVLQKLPLRHSAADPTVYPNVGYGSQVTRVIVTSMGVLFTGQWLLTLID